MSSTTDLSTVESFVTKLGIVFSRVKDAIIKDLSDGLPGNVESWDDVEAFVNAVVKKIGYDLSGNAPESKKVYELFVSLIGTSVDISEKVVDIIEATSKKKTLESAVQDLIKGANSGKGDLGGVKDVIDLVKDVIDLFKEISDIEWDEIAKEGEAFGKFIRDNYFTEEFARRIVDYVLITFLKYAREVFADDLNWLLENKRNDLFGVLKGKVEKFDVSKFNELANAFDECKTQLTAVEQALNDKIDDARAAVNDTVDYVVGLTKNQLETYKNVLRKRIDEIVDQIAPEFNATMKVLNQIYAVFEFLGVISKKKINLVSYINYVEIKDKSLDDFISLDPIEVEIPVFDWDIFEKIFTGPKEYFKTVFPVKNHQDLENLIIKISNLVRAFNKDFPQFDSLKQFVWDLLVRINNAVTEAGSSLAQDLKEQFDAVKKFLLDVLKVCEAIAIETKKTLSNAFNEFKNGAEGTFSTLSNQLKTDALKIKNDVQKELNKINVDENFKKIFVDTFTDAVSENVKKYCDESKLNSVVENIKAEINSSSSALFNKTTAFITNVNNEINGFFSGNLWTEKYNSVVNEIETEYQKQTKNIPSSISALKSFGLLELDNILSNGLTSVKNPFSDIDPMAYYHIVADNIEKLPKLDIYSYFKTFRNDVKNAVKDLVENIRDQIDQIKTDNTKFNTLIVSVVQSWWNKILETFVELVVKPYIDEIKDVIYDWAKDILQDVLKEVQNLIRGVSGPSGSSSSAQNPSAGDSSSSSGFSSGSSSLINTDGVIDGLKKYVEDVDSDAVINIVKEILELKDEHDADSWSTWKNVIKLAVNVYKVLPKGVKAYLTDIIDLPDIETISKYLPEYDFDAKNKFLAVTLFDKKTEEKDKSGAGEAELCIQLLVFIGEDPDGDSEDESEDKKDDSEGANKGKESEGEDGEDKSKKKSEGIFILPLVKGKFDVKFNVGKKHYMDFSAHSELNCKAEKNTNEKQEEKSKSEKIKDSLTKGKLGFFVKYSDKISETEIKCLADKDCVKAYLELLFQRGQVESNGEVKPADKITVFDTKIASLTLGDYPQKVFAGYDNGFDVGYCGGLRNLKLALKLKNQNSFFNTILKKDIQIELQKLDLQYSLKDGFKVDNALKVQIPINSDIDLDVVKFSNIGLDIGLDGNDLLANVSTSFTADLKGVSVTFTDMGLGIDCKLPFNGQKGFDFTPKFTYPNGLGISINIDGVKGGGAVQWDKERERFAGALELTIMEKVGASAMLVFTTGNGSDPFSIMGALCVYFDPGIQLGMGFSLEGIGGSFGVNRMIDTSKLVGAVKDGTLESALFFKDAAKNVDKILANVDKFYPIKKGQLYFGFLGRIAWGAIVKADFGLFIQLPSPTEIIVAGIIKVSVSEKVEKLLVINANFLGRLDVNKGFSFDAELYDSKIVGIELYGSMAIRIFWGGDTKGFILSLGGFHPQFNPAAGFELYDLKRIGMKLDYSILKMSLEAYFAITSNTVQFGTSLNLRIGWDKFGLVGYAAFNALFQFNPFWFTVDISAGLAVKIGSAKICSIDLSFELSGPAKWHAKGKASFWFLLAKISVGFDKSWGKDQIASNRSRIDVLPLFTNEFERKENWKFISSDLTDNMVSLIKFDENIMVLQPSDSILFNQNAVPLDQEMDCYGEDDLNDIKKLTISEVTIDEKKKTVADEESSFAPTLIKKLSEKDKLEKDSYWPMKGGFKFTDLGEVNNGFRKEFEPEVDEDVEQEIDMNLWETCSNKNLDLGSDLNQKEVDDFNKEQIELNKGQINFNTLYKKESKTTKAKKVSDKANDAYSTISKCSRRRNANGFNRFVKQWDEFLYSETKAKVEDILGK